MNDKEKLLDGLGFKHSLPPSFYLKITIFILVAIYLAIHTGEIFFGKNSLNVLHNVRANKEMLQKQVINIKNENANLQKNYFETLSLKPQIMDINLTMEVSKDLNISDDTNLSKPKETKNNLSKQE